MREFISWIEKEREVLFLAANDLEGQYGRETLRDVLITTLLVTEGN